jgi:hypothetical protein
MNLHEDESPLSYSASRVPQMQESWPPGVAKIFSDYIDNRSPIAQTISVRAINIAPGGVEETKSLGIVV